MRDGALDFVEVMVRPTPSLPGGPPLTSICGRRGDLVKLLWSDGEGMCLLTNRLERGRFV